MTYYEEDRPTEEEWVERIKKSIENEKPTILPTVDNSQERHEELMEMLGGIFVQLSRIYDVLITDSPNQSELDNQHSRGELFASPPTLVEKAWGEDVQDKD